MYNLFKILFNIHIKTPHYLYSLSSSNIYKYRATTIHAEVRTYILGEYSSQTKD